MKRYRLTFIVLLCSIYALNAQNPYGSVKNHNLDIKIDYNTKRLYVESQLTILNETNNQISEIPIILYRLLNVTSISTDEQPIVFHQEVKSFKDYTVLQVNTVKLRLKEPLYVSSSKKITIRYEGSLLGYSETGLSYIKDHINSDFTILRPDCLAYPVIGRPEFSTLKSIRNELFDYTIKVTVPNSLTVVNGGILESKIFQNDMATFIYKSRKPTSQIVTSIANYKKLSTNKVSTYYFEKDSVDAKKVHKVLLNTFDLYSKWWGGLKDESAFSLIEIPENYGSQATENYIIQTASAFNDENQLRQLYHEISHLWNVISNDENPSRWNEGLATFIEYKTVKKLEKRNDLDTELKRVYNTIKSNESYSQVPLIDFGKNDLTDRSYKVGFLFFYLLHQIVGEAEFNQLMKSFYKEYYATGATTNEFIGHLKNNSTSNLNKILNDWIYTTDYYKALNKYSNIHEIIEMYQEE